MEHGGRAETGDPCPLESGPGEAAARAAERAGARHPCARGSFITEPLIDLAALC